MNLDSQRINELLVSVSKLAGFWHRFVESTDAAEVHAIVSKLSPLELAAFDQRARSCTEYGYYYLKDWQNLKPSDVTRMTRSPYSTSLFGLLSFHSNGFVRNAAIGELATQLTGAEIPFLLIRLNDWVSQVRESASAAVKARINPTYAVHFLANISLVIRLRECGRVDQAFVDALFDLLKRPECNDVLQRGMTSKDKVVRRTSFQLAAESDPSARYSLISTLLMDSDAVARSWAVRHLLPEVPAARLWEVIEPMLKDPFMPIRREALWVIATKRPDLAVESIRRALLDDSISMRETARQFLSVADVPDVRELYINALAEGIYKRRFAAICGLGEVGTEADIQLLSPFEQATQPKIRRAVIYAMGKLDAARCITQLTAFLSDPMPGVSKEALKMLLSKARLIPLVELEEMLSNSSHFHVRRNALKLILHTDKWHKLPAVLNSCGDADERIADIARAGIHDWFANYNRSFAEPTRLDFERIHSVLSNCGEKLPSGVAKELTSCLKPYFK